MPMTRLCVPLALVASVLLAACGEQNAAPTDGDAVARVGEATLTETDLALRLGPVPPGDSAAARRAAIEAWVESELLVQEARRARLDREPDVARRLDDATRAVLEAAALERLFDNTTAPPPADAVARYYEAHRDELALREPYVRLRHLRVPAASAADATAALTAAASADDPDAAFAAVARRFDATDGAAAFAAAYVPESQLLSLDALLGARVASLSPGPRAVAIPSGDAVHVVQLVDRVGTGTIPPLAVVEAELSERLAIERRRDTEAQAVERLRAEAVARGTLVLR